MEPMMLGSPVSSPVQSPTSPGNAHTYLPSFLLGDINTPTKIGLTRSSDNSRHFNNSSFNPTSPLSNYGTPDYRANRQKVVFGNANTPNARQISGEGHSGGPPTRGLFDVLDTTSPIESNESVVHQNVAGGYPNQSSISLNTTSGCLLLDPMSMNTVESQGLLQWVTVFGFPPNAIDTVLSHISSRVRIIDKHSPPQPDCNWIHLKCASEQEAQRALACNGSTISGSIMIGVIPCTVEAVLLEPDKENRSRSNGSMRLFPASGKMRQLPDHDGSIRSPRIQNVRPLAVGYSQHLSPQSIKSSENVPQKSTSLVNKAMEYVFGW